MAAAVGKVLCLGPCRAETRECLSQKLGKQTKTSKDAPGKNMIKSYVYEAHLGGVAGVEGKS